MSLNPFRVRAPCHFSRRVVARLLWHKQEVPESPGVVTDFSGGVVSKRKLTTSGGQLKPTASSKKGSIGVH